MSLYNLLFGINSHMPILLATLGLKENDVERLRNVFSSEDGKTIQIYTRTGGNNREDYPNLTMRKVPGWQGSEDDDFDNTYCTDTFQVPAEFADDVKNLSDVLTHGLRAEFVQHLAKTLRREPSESDKETTAREAESAALRKLPHFMANGHTFVPMNDTAMQTALELAEANGGSLRTCWGIFPMTLTVKRDFYQWPNATDENLRNNLTRVEVGYDYKWTVDEVYWNHCQARWAEKFPLTMAKIAESVQRHLKAA